MTSMMLVYMAAYISVLTRMPASDKAMLLVNTSITTNFNG